MFCTLGHFEKRYAAAEKGLFLQPSNGLRFTARYRKHHEYQFSQHQQAFLAENICQRGENEKKP